MMARSDQSYAPRPGTLPDRILALLRARSPQPVSRADLRDTIGCASLKVVLSRMKTAGVIKASPDGFHLPQIKPVAGPYAPEPVTPAAPDLPDHLRQLLAAIIRRAHAFRLGGAGHEAARLLRQAAGAHGLDRMPHVRADLLAIADLFAAHGTTYPELDLRRVA